VKSYTLSLELIELLERQIAELDEQMRLLVEPLLPQIEQLDSIPGVDATAARDILGEIGTDMSRLLNLSLFVARKI
jgi:transposase